MRSQSSYLQRQSNKPDAPPFRFDVSATITFGTWTAAIVGLGSWHWLTSASCSAGATPLLLGFAAFIWIAGPWEVRQTRQHASSWLLALGSLSWLAGWFMGYMAIMTAGWILLVSQWIRLFFSNPKAVTHPSLYTLLLLSFPWVNTDLHALSWWFRISGAEISELTLSLVGCEVIRNGTQLSVDGIAISVENACSGMQSLQIMLLGGIAMSFLQAPSGKRLWWYVPVLIAAAWAANTMRILMTCGLAVAVSPEVASGAAHEWSGAIALLVMFSLCALVLSFTSKNRPDR